MGEERAEGEGRVRSGGGLCFPLYMTKYCFDAKKGVFEN